MKKYEGYLFVYFTGESEDGEQIYFAVSSDGLHWNDLNGGKPVLRSQVGEKGVRDPFIIRSVDDDKFYLIATDLRIASGKGWEAAQYEGSRSVVVWESRDLVNWSNERLVEVAGKEAGCVWAPEAIYDETRKKYMMFWASMVKEDGEEKAKQRIYCAFTEDFINFTKAMKYIEAETHVIDTTMIRNGEYYYRFSKNETTKVIQADRGKNLLNGPFEKMECGELDKIHGVEGPEIYKMNDSDKWCLIVDRFATQGGYMPLIADNLEQGNFKIISDADYDMGKNKKRHGGVINITGAEMERLMKAYK